MAKKKKKSAQKKVKKVVKKAARKIVKKSSAKKPKKPLTKITQSSAKPAQSVDYSRAVTPLGERLVVKLLQAEQVTAGGLIIPSTVKSQTGYLKAKVLAIGSGLKTKKGHLKPLDVQVGDTILFQGYASIKVDFKSSVGMEELHIVNESDVLGII